MVLLLDFSLSLEEKCLQKRPLKEPITCLPIVLETFQGKPSSRNLKKCNLEDGEKFTF